MLPEPGGSGEMMGRAGALIPKPRTLELGRGAFALTAGSKDAALLVSLPPGAYTAIVRGGAGATAGGVVLLEVYEVR